MIISRSLSLQAACILLLPLVLLAKLPCHANLIPEHAGTVVSIQLEQLMEKIDYDLLIFKPVFVSKYNVAHGFDFTDPAERKRFDWLPNFIQRPVQATGIDSAQPVYIYSETTDLFDVRIVAALKDVKVFEEFVRGAINFKIKEVPEW